MHPDGSLDEKITQTKTNPKGKEFTCECTMNVHLNEDGTRQITEEHSETDYDGTQKITECIRKETIQEHIIELVQKVAYISPGEEPREYNSKGDMDTIEVIMPDTEEIDINYAKDSISEFDYENVIVGIISSDGILFIPKDTVALIEENGYMMSITNDEIHLILDRDAMHNVYILDGDMEMSIHPTKDSEMTEEQKVTIGTNNAFTINLTVNDEYVHDLEGKADVTIRTGYKEIEVYYVAEDGSTEFIESSYDAENKSINMKLDHFSIYMLKHEEDEPVAPSTVSPYIILIVALICMYLPLAVLRYIERD